MGIIADAIAAQRDPRSGCTLGAFITSLEPEDRNDVIDVLKDPQAAMTALHRVINAPPFNAEIGYSTMRRHRSQTCKCGPDVWEHA